MTLYEKYKERQEATREQLQKLEDASVSDAEWWARMCAWYRQRT